MDASITRLAAFALGACAVSIVSAADAPRPSGLEERASARVYRMRLRIEPTWFAEPGACRDFAASDLEVVLRGERLADSVAWTLERTPEPAIHALLIDSSRSMIGKLDRARAAAIDYVGRLRPADERALVLAFDESVRLLQPVTGDRERLVQAIEGVRMSHQTALYDALVAALRELALYPERGVLLLLSDGLDTTSLYERADVFAWLEAEPDVTVFTVGLELPAITAAGPPGLLSTRKFLQRLASKTDGRFFDVPTASGLDRAYRRIRDLLDGEAVLGVVDPDPAAEPGAVRVSSSRDGCRVRVLGDLEDDAARDEPAIAGPRSFPVRPAPALVDPFRHLHVEDGGEGCGADWRLELKPGRITGCVFDVTMDYGVLYDPFPRGLQSGNDWLRVRRRAIEIPTPAVDELPRAPDEAMDRLAARALAFADHEVESDPRRRPPAEHARPYYDNPLLAHESTFFDLRPALAQALYAREDYRRLAQGQLRREADRELGLLAERMRAVAPQRTEEERLAVMRESETAKEIAARVQHPTVRDLERHLAAWLGEVAASDLFRRWEERKVLDMVARSAADEGFAAAWTELRRLFWVPSYTRALTLLVPGRDPDTGRIGLWQVLLPRPGWITERLKGKQRVPDLADLPLDLIPDLPLGYFVVRTLVEGDPELAKVLAAGRYGTISIRYELLGRSGKHDPGRAFRASRVTVDFAGSPAGDRADFRIEADLSLRGAAREPRIERLQRFPTAGDPERNTANRSNGVSAAWKTSGGGIR